MVTSGASTRSPWAPSTTAMPGRSTPACGSPRRCCWKAWPGPSDRPGTPSTTRSPRPRSGCTRPSAPGRGRRSAAARSAAAATSRRSPPPGSTGTTPGGSCTAPGCARRPRLTPRTGRPARPDTVPGARPGAPGLTWDPRGRPPARARARHENPRPAAGPGYGRPPHVKPGSRPGQRPPMTHHATRTVKSVQNRHWHL